MFADAARKGGEKEEKREGLYLIFIGIGKQLLTCDLTGSET